MIEKNYLLRIGNFKKLYLKLKKQLIKKMQIIKEKLGLKI